MDFCRAYGSWRRTISSLHIASKKGPVSKTESWRLLVLPASRSREPKRESSTDSGRARTSFREGRCNPSAVHLLPSVSCAQGCSSRAAGNRGCQSCLRRPSCRRRRERMRAREEEGRVLAQGVPIALGCSLLASDRDRTTARGTFCGAFHDEVGQRFLSCDLGNFPSGLDGTPDAVFSSAGICE